MLDVDLRSDTVTQPSSGMRSAMAAAQVGDDVYGEDPTVNRLQAECAERLGCEAGLFVASGTQSNLTALLTHCRRGDEYIAGQDAHTYRFEGGGAAALGGIQPQPLPFQPDGTLCLAAVAAAIKPNDVHFAQTKLVCLENTQGGKAIPPSYFAQVRQLADRHGLMVHLDGARLFNAAVAQRVDVADIAGRCDSVSLCLSKGLGAPAGSVLCGSKPFVDAARRWRKMLGGGMRQAGVLAAAGLYALRHHVEQLAEDHQRAARLADSLRSAGFDVACHTNMIFLRAMRSELADGLAARRIRVSGNRWVIHRDIDDAAVLHVVKSVAALQDQWREAGVEGSGTRQSTPPNEPASA